MLEALDWRKMPSFAPIVPAMNAPLPASLLSTVELAPRDPILGVTEAFVADTNPKKVNLGVGVYYDDDGKLPLLECVRRAEHEIADKGAPRGYLPIDGIPAYDRRCRALLFGADSDVVKDGRGLTVQALGGTGGLKVGADFLRRFAPGAQVWISDPSWENHRALFEGAGFTVNQYAYYDAATRGLDFDGMIAAPREHSRGRDRRAARVLPQPDRRGSDARPSGTRSSTWCARAAWCRSSTLPTRDSATASMPTARVVRAFAATPGPLFVSSSFSKSFSLYGERVGALSVVARPTRTRPSRVLSQVKRVVRTNYSNPPTHGGEIVATVLRIARTARRCGRPSSPSMRDRIKKMRALLVERLHAAAARPRFQLHARRSAACSRTRASPRSRSSACATSSRSTRSTPAASAWRRSTPRTSTTWRTPSPR